MLEAFCQQEGYDIAKIAVASHRTPDYEVTAPGGTVVCEVKQFDPNREEIAAHAAWARGEAADISTKPGQRIRSAIATAVRQLKRASKGAVPNIVVLCDPNGLRHGGEYNIRVAMYGYDTMVLAVPRDAATSPRLIGRKSGGGRTMTPAHCTSISAVAELRRADNDVLELDIYHNHFAHLPLDPATFHAARVRQYRLAASTLERFDVWAPVDVA